MWLFNKLEDWEEEYFARMFNHNSGNDDGTTIGWGPEGLNVRAKGGDESESDSPGVIGGIIENATNIISSSSHIGFIGGGEDARIDC